eukprot:CAMPEP_0170512992 /NCGR_PEP_ID=MMETSP0208-20121228/67155_1 /TAXON_ID=197538 /ORGANISM="Strombidium inclinatum, Strain S3" /LENGTH=149 /DNA_ID=CAMNT_0010796677 /DNA_START=458 /DNA_END=904 /DNA_ORIENTATION=-
MKTNFDVFNQMTKGKNMGTKRKSIMSDAQSSLRLHGLKEQTAKKQIMSLIQQHDSPKDRKGPSSPRIKKEKMPCEREGKRILKPFKASGDQPSSKRTSFLSGYRPQAEDRSSHSRSQGRKNKHEASTSPLDHAGDDLPLTSDNGATHRK